jgi:hypothetical protein
MGLERVLMAYVFLATIIAFLCYIIYKIFWFKAIVPEAKYTKWQWEEINEAIKKAREILKSKK